MSDVIPQEVDVYRVIRPRMIIYVPSGAKYPTWEAFRPTDQDKRQTPVRVSVWDSRRTTSRQAKALRVAATEADATRQSDALQVFELGVSDVVRTGERFKNPRMRVVRDPEGITAEIISLPGADGHSGIEGLDRDDGTPKSEWKQVLNALAERCRPADDAEV
jgi:hypothetical protein